MYKVTLILDKFFLKYEGGWGVKLTHSPEKTTFKRPSFIKANAFVVFFNSVNIFDYGCIYLIKFLNLAFAGNRTCPPKPSEKSELDMKTSSLSTKSSRALTKFKIFNSITEY